MPSVIPVLIRRLAPLWRGFALASALLLGFPALQGATTGAPGRPNILWIVSEDNSPYLGCYGDAQAQTPHLDRLAAQGVRYRNAFSNAPVCSTTRTTLITGMHATTLGAHHHRSRVRIPAGFKLYPEHLRAAGYYTTNNAKTDYNLAGNPQPWHESSNQAHYRKRAPGQPFFAVFNLGSSHESQVAPKAGKTSFRIPPEKIVLPPYHPDTPEIRRDLANYYDQMTIMDGQAGALLAELEQAGLAEDTIVFYCGDHGGALPRGKRNIHDSGTRVPLIVRIPAKWAALAPAQPGSWVDQLVSFVDLPITFLSLIGAPLPPNYEGKPFLGAQQAAPRDTVFLYRGRMDERYDVIRAVRDGEARYVRNYSPHRPWGQHYTYPFQVQPSMRSWFAAFTAGQCNDVQAAYWRPKPSEEFYMIAGDPHELRNLAAEPQYATRKTALQQTLRAELIATRDTGFIPEGMAVRLAGEKTIYDYAQSPAYPIERILDLADRATSRDVRHLPALQAALSDSHPVLRYWGALGCLILQTQAGPAQAALRTALRDEFADIRIVAAEALGYHGAAEAGVTTLVEVIQHQQPYEQLAALNALEYMFKAGHVPLARVQEIVRNLKLAEPLDRIPAYLLSLK